MQTTAVYACVRVIAETVASLPLHTYRAVSHVSFSTLCAMEILYNN